MQVQVECKTAAAVLQSGRTISAWANAAGIVAALAFFSSARLVSGALGLSLGCWIAGNILAVRVRIDEGLFRAWAAEPDAEAAQLDAFLLQWKLIRRAKPRQWSERNRGALQLWRMQQIALVAQIVALCGAWILHFIDPKW